MTRKTLQNYQIPTFGVSKPCGRWPCLTCHIVKRFENLPTRWSPSHFLCRAKSPLLPWASDRAVLHRSPTLTDIDTTGTKI